jgi:hypothetical protein
MLRALLSSAATAAMLMLLVPALPASAQTAAPQRDCQTLVKCQFSRGASFRGCISSYSCRQCRFVPGRCTGVADRRSCSRLVCGWGA